MTRLSEVLAGKRVVVEFPMSACDDWMAVGEVLVQERLRAWAWPIDNVSMLPDVLRMFGRRVTIGVYDVRTPADLERAQAAGARFVTSPVTKPILRDAACPVLLGAWTVNEIEAASELGVETVQIVPGDLVQYGYYARVTRLFPDLEIVASGPLSASDAETALRDGCEAVIVAGESLAPSSGLTGLDLDALRMRCRTYADLG